MSRQNKATPWKGKKVALGYCHREELSAFFHTSVIALDRQERNRMGKIIGILSGPKIDSARNTIFRIWLDETDDDYLLMVDTDMYLPINLVDRLLKHDKDIVGGLCFSGRSEGGVTPAIRVITDNGDGPTIEPLWDYPTDSLVQVAAIGAACMLVKREVAETVLQARGEDHPMPWFAHGAHNGVEIGEDVAFCLTAGKVGFEVWVDTGMIILHDKHRFVGDAEYVLSLSREDHPYYNLREKVPIYQELVNGDSG